MPPDPPSLLPPSPSPPAQAVRCITQSAHSGEAILFAKLKTDLRKLMEKGRVYKAGSGELIAWGVRFFFGSEKGLCYQHVGRKLRPVGTKKVIPWGAITKVEALEDDSVYVETQALKRYYLKPKDSAQPAVEAWQWATALCRLGVLPPPEVEVGLGYQLNSDPPALRYHHRPPPESYSTRHSSGQSHNCWDAIINEPLKRSQSKGHIGSRWNKN